MNLVALIPARAGSKRIPGKNTRDFFGHPLLAYAIDSAQRSGIFSQILVCTDSVETARVANHYGALARIQKPPCHTDECLDITWVKEAMPAARTEAFSILRPTSPFRTPAMIRRAYDAFVRSEVHSLRAVEPVKQHPGKMWQCLAPGYPMVPLLDTVWPPEARGNAPMRLGNGQPWHSRPTQTLPRVYIQNASLEMAWTYVLKAFGTISGTKVAPFYTEGYEGFDLNTEDDWREAERLVRDGLVTLPALSVESPQTPTAA